MAEEIEFQDGWIIRSLGEDLDLRELEGFLFATAPQLENWDLADQARRHLGDLTMHLSSKVPWPIDRQLPLEKIDGEILIKQAMIGAAAVALRGVGSAMALVACGYSAESSAALRRVGEAKLNVKAVLDDPSGQYARRYLGGRGRKLGTLASNYKHPSLHDLSKFAHANIAGLRPLKAEDGQAIDFAPSRKPRYSDEILFILAFEAIQISELAPKPFDLLWELPRELGDALKDAGARLGRKITLREGPPEPAAR